MTYSNNKRGNKTKMESKTLGIHCIGWIKKWYNRLIQNKYIGYCILLWLLLLCVVIGFFFSSYVIFEIIIVAVLVFISFIALFVEKSISKWVIFVVSLAFGLFFLNVIFYEERLPQEIPSNQLYIISPNDNDSIHLSEKDIPKKNDSKSIEEINLLENSKKVLSPYINRKSDWFAIILSLISLIFVVYTWRSQDKTQKNTQRITPDIQKGILKDFFRHSYKNLIILTAIRIRLRQEGYDNFYPAEYHITKLQTGEDCIYPEVFIDNDYFCGRLHEMKLFVRNGNLEIKEVLEHLKNPNLDSKYKERGIDLINKRIKDIMDRAGSILKELYGMDEETEISQQIKQYMFEKPSNASERVRNEFKTSIKQIIEGDDTERSIQFSKLCTQNTPEAGIVDYSIFIDFLYPKEKSDNKDDKTTINEETNSIIESPQTIDGFVKRINAEICKMVDELHLIPFSK